ncbi:transposable element Tcb1 transposase [Trichonephila clavipes]|nr:transposable element Tcb1 transposase [Trichonephila clavipes]
MALMDRAATSRAMSQELGSFARQQVLARAVQQLVRSLTFQQDNARPHVAGVVRIFLDTENVRLLPWPARSPYLFSLENSLSMVTKRLVVTIRQSLRLMSCSTYTCLKLLGHLYMYMPSNLCSTQCPVLLSLQRWMF